MLKWSLKLFRVFGIPLAVHSTFFLLAGYMAWEGWYNPPVEHLANPIYGALINVAVLVVFFTCVVLHELGHALTARRFGVATSRILLLPIGGMAEFDSIPRQPSSEILIALAGPAVNFIIVGLLLFFVPFPGEEIMLYFRSLFSTGGDGAEVNMSILQELLTALLTMNLLMGCFNLVPVFPMDGGRVLRALLATRLSYLRATLYAATIAKVLATTAVVAAVSSGRWLLAGLFAFIFFAGEMEYRVVRRRERDDERWRKMLTELEEAAVTPPPLPDVFGRSS
jgi:Zn-dependent protease